MLGGLNGLRSRQCVHGLESGGVPLFVRGGQEQADLRSACDSACSRIGGGTISTCKP